MAGDEASRRRLPSWMKKPDNGGKTNNPAPKNKISSETKKKPATISTQPLTTINKRKVSKSNKLVPRDDGEGELSVEDLLSIAKEYVQNDLDSPAELQSLDRDLETLNQPLESTSTEDGIISSCSGTGDFAQVMLDLFFGPLLKKPREDKEKKIEFSTYDEGFRQLCQNNVGDEMVSQVKLKSSLKDKASESRREMEHNLVERLDFESMMASTNAYSAQSLTAH